MKTEAKMSFGYCFLMSEQELRRIVDSLIQSFKKISPDEKPLTEFEVKYKNGAISQPSSIDEIVTEENIGSGLITRLNVHIQNKAEEPNYLATIEFINPEIENERYDVSIRYTLTGDDRDWVFISSSELEERLSRIRRGKIYDWIINIQNSETSIVLYGLLLLVGMLLGIFGNSRPSNLQITIDQLNSDWHQGKITDPIEMMLKISEAQALEQSKPLSMISPMIVGMGAGIGIAILLYAFLKSIVYFFPPYNFNWGEYMKFFQRRESLGKFVYVGVILTVILSIVANAVGISLGIR